MSEPGVEHDTGLMPSDFTVDVIARDFIGKAGRQDSLRGAKVLQWVDGMFGRDFLVSTGLTVRQADVLRFVALETMWWGFPPTIRDIGRAFGYRSINGAVSHIEALAKKGRILYHRFCSRGIALVGVQWVPMPVGVWPEAAPEGAASGETLAQDTDGQE